MAHERPVEPILTPAAKEQPGVEPGTAELMMKVCRDRRTLWERLGDVLSAEALSSESETRAWVDGVNEVTLWLGEDQKRVGPTFQAALEFLNQAKLASKNADETNVAWQKFRGEGLEWAERSLREEGALDQLRRRAEGERVAIEREISAWEGLDIDEAKHIRAESRENLLGWAEDAALDVSVPLLDPQSGAAGRLISEYVLLVLTLESGQDFQTAAYARSKSTY